MGGRRGHKADPAPGRVMVVVTTHTTRHLAACVASLAWQRIAPAAVAVSCDTDDPAIGRLLDWVWPEAVEAARGRLDGTALIHVSRPHQGVARPNQVRNNGVRALDQVVGLRETDLVVGIDGDVMLAPDAIERHGNLAAKGYEVVIPFRVCLDEPATASVDARDLLRRAAAGEDPVAGLATADDLSSLEERQRRYERQLRLRPIMGPIGRMAGVDTVHKPKILGAHYAVGVRALRAVNGMDEEYTGYGYEDDDLSRRLLALRPRPRVAIAARDILVYHLWHPSRAPQRPTEAPGYARFSTPGLPVRARRGWDNPAAQDEPRVRVVEARAAAPVSG